MIGKNCKTFNSSFFLFALSSAVVEHGGHAIWCICANRSYLAARDRQLEAHCTADSMTLSVAAVTCPKSNGIFPIQFTETGTFKGLT